MQKFSMTCPCGHETAVEAATRDEAVANVKAIMTPEFIDQHFAEMHPGQPKISMAQAHVQVDQMLAVVPM